MLTWTSWPSPVRSRCSSAASAPSNATYAVTPSTRNCPAGCGVSPERPTDSSAPLIACRSRSWPGPVRVGAVLAVARHRDVDDLRVERAQRLVVHAQALGDAGPVVLQEDVGRARQLPEDLAALLRLEVDREAALVAVEREEARVDAVPRRAAAGDVAVPLARDGLDLDHVGPQIAEAHRGQRAGHGDRAVEHAHARERAAARLRRAFREPVPAGGSSGREEGVIVLHSGTIISLISSP